MSEEASFSAVRLWSKERAELHKMLSAVDSNHASTLAGLYRYALTLMDHEPKQGEEASRLALVGHCFRELMNNFQDAMGDVPGLTASKRHVESSARMALKSEFEAIRESVGETENDSANSANGPELVTVNRSLVVAIGDYFAAVNDGTMNRRERASAAVLGLVDHMSPALRPWFAAEDFFNQWVHIDRHPRHDGTHRTTPTDQEIITHIENVEAALRVRLGEFFDNLHNLEELIYEANQGDLEQNL